MTDLLTLRTSDFDFELPPELIAQHPPERREDARLMVLDRRTGETTIGRFPDLLGHLRSRDLLVLNETRVIPARLYGERPETGGRVELLLLEPTASGTWIAMGRPSRSLEMVRELRILDAAGKAVRVGIEPFRSKQFLVSYDGKWEELLERAGHVPLPPYIRRAETPEDRERYQTVFARVPGAIAAPTAGLHFTPELLAEAEERGIEIARIVLHVGPGTFKPVTVADPRNHRLEPERFGIPREAAESLRRARRAGSRIVAVGTTVVRTLETGAELLFDEERAEGEVVAAVSGAASKLIVPPYEFRAVDALVTNFHLPRSSLLFLVSALAGREAVLAAYRRAVAERFRFYSYGDAMFVV
jgi:S-adenosylmethionine:tRNA ribosyltransferase-isomerase